MLWLLVRFRAFSFWERAKRERGEGESEEARDAFRRRLESLRPSEAGVSLCA